MSMTHQQPEQKFQSFGWVNWDCVICQPIHIQKRPGRLQQELRSIMNIVYASSIRADAVSNILFVHNQPRNHRCFIPQGGPVNELNHRGTYFVFVLHAENFITFLLKQIGNIIFSKKMPHCEVSAFREEGSLWEKNMSPKITFRNKNLVTKPAVRTENPFSGKHRF